VGRDVQEVIEKCMSMAVVSVGAALIMHVDVFHRKQSKLSMRESQKL